MKVLKTALLFLMCVSFSFSCKEGVKEPAFALHSATLLNAELAGIADVTGSVEAGKAADLIVCPADPLADLTALRRLSMVIRDGWCLENPTVKKMPEVERELDKFL